MSMSTEILLNIITVWIIAEVYCMHPRGFKGSPLFVLLSWLVACGAVVLLAVNVVYALINLWSAYGER